MIKQFIQGRPATESELFASLGSMVLSEEVHRRLGTSVNSRTGDIWWIFYDRGGARAGFAQARNQKNGLNVRYLYAIGHDGSSELTDAIVKFSSEVGCPRIFHQGEVGAHMWKKAGFSFVPNANDDCGTWEKNM